LNVLEDLINKCNSGHFSEVESLYYKYWLHSGQEVKIYENDGDTFKNVNIIGIDEFGFLRVKNEDDQEFAVFDNGNSFDMIKGLIRSKSRK